MNKEQRDLLRSLYIDSCLDKKDYFNVYYKKEYEMLQKYARNKNLMGKPAQVNVYSVWSVADKLAMSVSFYQERLAKERKAANTALRKYLSFKQNITDNKTNNIYYWKLPEVQERLANLKSTWIESSNSIKRTKYELALASIQYNRFLSWRKATDDYIKYLENDNYDLRSMMEPLKESHYWNRCKYCEFRHENGNCLPVGGYFSAVDDKYCPKMKEKAELIQEIQELKEKLKSQE